MRVNRLLLKNFRGYEQMEAEFYPGVNLIVGDNAQGKTNLLESIVYLSEGSSYRSRREEELIRWEADYARLEAEIQTARRDISLVYVLFRGARTPADPAQRRQTEKCGGGGRSFEHGAVLSGRPANFAGWGGGTEKVSGQRHCTAPAPV